MDEQENLSRRKKASSKKTKTNWLQKMWQSRKKQSAQPEGEQEAEVNSVPTEQEHLSRSQTRQARTDNSEADKKSRLGRRLNFVIIILVLLIIGVYLFIRFVNF